MIKEYDNTPSFYNSEEMFEKYLGRTSYYIGLQDNVEKLIGLIRPEKVIELGSATGATSIRIAKKYPDVKVLGLDMRQDIVDIANDTVEREGLTNVKFALQDMTKTVKYNIKSDFVLMLYSFHHILDPIDNKIAFLHNAFRNMREGAYLCIAETFISDNANGNDDKEAILKLWNIRKDEGYCSTFWSSLSGIDKDSIILAEQIGAYCSKNEYLAGELVAERNEEYLVQPKWLIEEAEKVGFKVIINQPINTVEDRIVLLQK